MRNLAKKCSRLSRGVAAHPETNRAPKSNAGKMELKIHSALARFTLIGKCQLRIRNWKSAAQTPDMVTWWPWCKPNTGVPLKQQVGGKILHGRKSNKHVGPISCAHCAVQFGTKSGKTRRFSFIYQRKGRLIIAFTGCTRREHLHAPIGPGRVQPRRLPIADPARLHHGLVSQSSPRSS